MKTTKSIYWTYLVKKREATVKATKELDVAMDTDVNFDEKYDSWETAKEEQKTAELGWKEYNEAFNGAN